MVMYCGGEGSLRREREIVMVGSLMTKISGSVYGRQRRKIRRQRVNNFLPSNL
jgi:hypothetical protein